MIEVLQPLLMSMVFISFDISRWSFIRTPYGKVHCEHNVRFQTILLLDIYGFYEEKCFLKPWVFIKTKIVKRFHKILTFNFLFLLLLLIICCLQCWPSRGNHNNKSFEFRINSLGLTTEPGNFFCWPLLNK